ncbi:DNA internalization-related competence protein ComEC/Rec2 [Gracilibacillus sp. S3-1-1]|uniref:DNA internalization-related competence protein ComEC/Rec2 n=1 Tax=Gracilibacillus pellucidus TaxID=3095368 RepID=A0ACC6M570_9BACI|nr:DNA internalization-related competence protein ComEC/Rec2 [Gracilibacillus sp. S3-1-1]MDX8045927.1 DNA internalization-related competence protein ComEC/Rec2 [Gracilibacillus sp. S3-1-1]
MYQRLHWFVIIYVLCFLMKDIDVKAFIVLGVVISMYFIASHRFPKWLIASLILFMVVSYYQLPSLPTYSHADETNASDSLQGTITSQVEHNENYIRFVFRTLNDKRVQVYYFVNKEDISLNHSVFKTGATCALTGTFQSIPSKRNPGQFDYQHYLATQGIEQQFVIDPTLSNDCQGSSAWQKIVDLRNQILTHIENHVSSFTYSWFAALLFGQRDYVEDETIDLFQNWNLTHLLAISGLHVGLILAIVYMLFLFMFRITVEKAQILIACLLFLYPLMAGGAPSVWRASLLAIVVIVFSKLPLRLSTTDLLSIVFLLMVMFNPFIIYSLAFQFSFIVTFSIILSARLLNEPVSYMWIALRVSLISMLVILPIQLHNFYHIQPLSVLLNILIIPYFTIIVLPLLFIMLLLSPISNILPIFDHIFSKIHSSVLTLLNQLDSHISATWVIGEFPFVLYFPYYLLLWMFLINFERKKWVEAMQYSVLLVLLLVFCSVKPYLDSNGYITMLDIGQGDAMVIELPYRQAVILMDAGGKLEADFSQASSEIFDQIIDPFLKSKGISKLDAIILSHADHDHVGSVPDLLNHYEVEAVITSPFFDEEIKQQYQQIDDAVEYYAVKGGDSFQVKKQAFEVFYPVQNNTDKNENSLVLSSKFGPNRWLFTGDLGKTGEKEIINQYSNLQADILKVGHHGSKSSSSTSFLSTLGAKIGLISVGQHNRYNHPHHEVLNHLSDHHMSVMRTDEQGAIIYKYSKESGTFYPFIPYNTVDKQ